MKKIKLVVVGKLKEKFYVDACNEYLKRIKRFADITVCELKDRASDIQTESTDILASIEDFTILADIGGEQLSSEEFSALITGAMEKHGTVTFVIGGSMGVDERVKRRADRRVGFGKMTYPHMLMRVIALEQIYRAFTIKEGMPYHK